MRVLTGSVVLDIVYRARSYYSLFKADEEDDDSDRHSHTSDVSGRGDLAADDVATSTPLSPTVDSRQSQTKEAALAPDDVEAVKKIELERLWELNKAAKAIEELIHGATALRMLFLVLVLASALCRGFKTKCMKTTRIRQRQRKK